MKKIAVLAFVMMLAVGAITSTASASDGLCQWCCKVCIYGYTLSCGGFYIPNADVRLNGPLARQFQPMIWASDSTGCFGVCDLVPLGNYFGNYLDARAIYQVGGQTVLYYYGQSCYFDVNCYVVGQVVQIGINVPLWVI
jgi:hypothetical protein